MNLYKLAECLLLFYRSVSHIFRSQSIGLACVRSFQQNTHIGGTQRERMKRFLCSASQSFKPSKYCNVLYCIVCVCVINILALYRVIFISASLKHNICIWIIHVCLSLGGCFVPLTFKFSNNHFETELKFLWNRWNHENTGIHLKNKEGKMKRIHEIFHAKLNEWSAHHSGLK